MTPERQIPPATTTYPIVTIHDVLRADGTAVTAEELPNQLRIHRHVSSLRFLDYYAN